MCKHHFNVAADNGGANFTTTILHTSGFRVMYNNTS